MTESRFPPRLSKSDGGEDDLAYFTRVMTPELAAFIRESRTGGAPGGDARYVGASWRGVGAAVHEAFPDLGIHPVSWDPQVRWVSQLTGQDLCIAAMNFLGEKESDGWN